MASFKKTSDTPAPSPAMPGWEHPEYGLFEPVPVSVLATVSDEFYWDKLTALIRKKWKAVSTDPCPPMGYGLMWRTGDDRSWGGTPVIFVDLSRMRRGSTAWHRTAAGILKTGTMVKSMDDMAYVSPFFEWGLAEYWERGLYDL